MNKLIILKKLSGYFSRNQLQMTLDDLLQCNKYCNTPLECTIKWLDKNCESLMRHIESDILVSNKSSIIIAY